MIIDDHLKHQQETVPRAFLGNWNPRESLANQNKCLQSRDPEVSTLDT